MNMKIGELAQLAGCKDVTIRYYENQGLMGSPKRSSGNYRLYDGEDVERLHFIRHCRENGMNLNEIRELLSYKDGAGGDCDWVCELIDNHISNVDSQIRSLKKLKGYLKSLRVKCNGGNSADSCQILQSLTNAKN